MTACSIGVVHQKINPVLVCAHTDTLTHITHTQEEKSSSKLEATDVQV